MSSLSSPLLLTLTRALAPGVLRMGGSSANFLTYDPTVQDPSSPPLSDVQASSFNEILESLEGPHGAPPASQDVRGDVLIQRTDDKLNQVHSGDSGSVHSRGASPHTHHRRHEDLANKSDADHMNATDLTNHTDTNRTDDPRPSRHTDYTPVSGPQGDALSSGRGGPPSEPSCDSSYSSSSFKNFTMTGEKIIVSFSVVWLLRKGKRGIKSFS